MREPAATIDPQRYTNLGHLLSDALLQFKSNTAFIEYRRKVVHHKLSYLDAWQESRRLLGGLIRQGLRRGDRVAIIMSNQSRWPVSATAVFLGGAVLVPIDYKLSPREQLSLLKHCGARFLFTESPIYEALRNQECSVGNADATSKGDAVLKQLCTVVSEAPEDQSLGENLRWETRFAPKDIEAQRLASLATRNDTACIVYSSGTGGTPKGCMLSHDAYLEQLRSLVALYPIVEGDRYFSILPSNHAIDFMCGFIGPLCGGAAVVHQRTLRPEFILETMQSARVTHMAVVPLILQAFKRSIDEKVSSLPTPKRLVVQSLMQLNAKLTRDTPKARLSRNLLGPIHRAFGGELKLLFCGGAFVDESCARFFYELGIPVVIGYGLTECCTVATVNDLNPFRADTVGRALDGVDLIIEQPNGDGVGEVWLRSRTIMQGYLNDPEGTQAVLKDGFLRTGDLGYLDAAQHLHLLGRSKNMIVTEGGKNVYPEDVESALGDMPSPPSSEVAVFAKNYIWKPTFKMSGKATTFQSSGKHEDQDQDQAQKSHALQGEGLIVVVHTPDRKTAEASREQLLLDLKACNRKLPEHKRLSSVLFWGNAFPRTASMKLKRELLAEAMRSQSDTSELLPL